MTKTEDEQNLTAEQCEELAAALSEEAALLPLGSKKDELLRLAQSYRNLAIIKGLVGRKVN